jgi:hypothetical protein
MLMMCSQKPAILSYILVHILTLCFFGHIVLLVSHLFQHLQSGVFLLSFPTRILWTIVICHACFIHHQSIRLKKIRWKSPVMKFFAMKCCPFQCYLISFKFRYFKASLANHASPSVPVASSVHSCQPQFIFILRGSLAMSRVRVYQNQTRFGILIFFWTPN